MKKLFMFKLTIALTFLFVELILSTQIPEREKTLNWIQYQEKPLFMSLVPIFIFPKYVPKLRCGFSN
jgi:hypothetical protein